MKQGRRRDDMSQNSVSSQLPGRCDVSMDGCSYLCTPVSSAAGLLVFSRHWHCRPHALLISCYVV